MTGAVRTIIDKSIYRKDSKRWFSALALDYAVIAGAIAATFFFPHWYVYVLAAIVIGNRQHALSILGHDGSHYLITPNRKWNDRFNAWLVWWPLMVPAEGYRKFHNEHHKYAGEKEDPELEAKSLGFLQWKLPLTRTQIFINLMISCFGGGLYEDIRLANMMKPGPRDMIPMIAMHAVLAPAIWYMGGTQILLLWYIPLYTTFWMFIHLRMYTEHVGIIGTHRLHMSRLAQELIAPHNVGYHWEHHNHPGVPFHNLPAMRELLATPAIMTLDELAAFYADPAGKTQPDGATVLYPT